MTSSHQNLSAAKPSLGGGFRGWLSSRTPGFFGVEYSSCTPVLARGSALSEDLAGRKIEWSKPPKDVVFYNLAPDSKIVGSHKIYELDYVLGESDAAVDVETRLGNGTLIYWAPVAHGTEFEFDNALILRYIDVHSASDLEAEDVNPEWLCLRRVGHTDGQIVTDDGKLILRSLAVQSGEILYDEIEPHVVRGRVFGSYAFPANRAGVRMAASLPFAPEEP